VSGRLDITLVPVQAGQLQVYPGIPRLYALRPLQETGGALIFPTQARLPRLLQ
jgi:hypothetical protein